MSTRILTWNIQKFSLEKVIDQGKSKAKFNTGKTDYKEAVCLEDILKIFDQVKPDIFAIIEIQANKSTIQVPGELIGNENALNGLFYLLKKIRAIDGFSDFSLVPPINFGGCLNKVQGEEYFREDEKERESVAVFYNAKKLQFIGPNVLQEVKYLIETRNGNEEFEFTQSLPTEGLKTNAIGNYTVTREKGRGTKKMEVTSPLSQTIGGVEVKPFSDVAESRSLTIDGNVIKENEFAAQVEYYDKDKKRIPFPNDNSRPPYLTRFVELEGKKRTINFFTIHTSPSGQVTYSGIKYAKKEGAKYKEATTSDAYSVYNLYKGIDNFSSVSELSGKIDKNEVKIIGGDFNLDLGSPVAIASIQKFAIEKEYKIPISPLELKNVEVLPEKKGGSVEYKDLYYINPALLPYCKTVAIQRKTGTKKGKDGNIIKNPDGTDKIFILKQPSPLNNSESKDKLPDYLRKGPYPAFGCLDKAYDYFLFKLGKNAKNFGLPKATILNFVTGAPYNWPVKKPQGVDILPNFIGYEKLDSFFDTSINGPIPGPDANNDDLGGVSYHKDAASVKIKEFDDQVTPSLANIDHMPIFIEI